MMMSEGDAISEESSEKRGRGRPPLFSAMYESYMPMMGAKGCRRSCANLFYRMRAFGRLFVSDGDLDEARIERFRWLFDNTSEQSGRKQSILAELGRIEDPDLLTEVADLLCERQPKARDAVALVRRIRLGRIPPGDTLQLANEIITTINAYLARYPDTSDAQVMDALVTAADQARSVGRGGGGLDAGLRSPGRGVGNREVSENLADHDKRA